MQFEQNHDDDSKEINSKIAKLEQDVRIWKSRALKAEADYVAIKERENKIRQNGENITLALTAAIEKAQQIENSSKNVYKLKIQQISLLYDRWEKLLGELLAKYPKLEQSHNVKQMLVDFKKAIESVVSKNDCQRVGTPQETSNDTMRSLLSKMSTYSSGQNARGVKRVERNFLSKNLSSKRLESKKQEEPAKMIKPITDLTLDKGEGYETLAEKFLTNKEEQNNAYTNFFSKNIEQEASMGSDGFDLKEAVNPKDDLDEIMKAFDFFNDIAQD